jgi:hypothetical protein
VKVLTTRHLHVLHTEQDYEYAVALLDRLIDRVGEDKTHPLASERKTKGR